MEELLEFHQSAASLLREQKEHFLPEDGVPGSPTPRVSERFLKYFLLFLLLSDIAEWLLLIIN